MEWKIEVIEVEEEALGFADTGSDTDADVDADTEVLGLIYGEIEL